MNTQLVNQFIQGVRLVQGLTGETVTIGGQDYLCTASDMVTGDPEFVAGGLIKKLMITVTVLKADFPDTPVVDALCSFRGYPMRTITCSDAGISWQIQLIQEGA